VPDDFVLATGRPTLIRNEDGRGYTWVPHPTDIKEAIEEAEAFYGRAPILVVIDTVFRSFGGGNVNESSHMNAYVAAAQEIADGGCAVCLVHHTTKSGTSPAGSVALIGAADTLVGVTKNEDGTHTWTVEEAKDDASGVAVGFRLEVVDGIIDASGEEVTSCVLVPLAPDETSRHDTAGRGRRPSAQRIDKVLEILAVLLNKSNNLTVSVSHWRDAVYQQTMPGDDPNTKRMAFNRDRDRLVAQGRVIATGDMVTVP
jgi:hypothetical protein